MTEKTNVIKSRDYECYKIILPFSAFTGKKRKKCLCSELEKMHPCFSNEYSFDSSISQIKKKGFMFEVFVINKNKLAEYESKRRFPGTGFFMASESEDRKKRRFFISRKWKMILFVFLCCFIAGIFGAISGQISGIKRQKAMEASAGRQKTEVLQNSALIKVSDENLPEKNANLEAAEYIKTPPENLFFDALIKSNGKIRMLEFNIQGFSRTLTASLSGVFSEEISGLSELEENFGPVIYENGIPKMKVFYRWNEAARQKAGEESEKPEVSEPMGTAKNSQLSFSKELRNLIYEYGADVKEENTWPYHIDFICNRTTRTEELLQNISDFLIQNNTSLSYVLIQSNGGGEIRAGLSVGNLPFEGFDLKLLARNLSVFLDEEKLAEPKQMNPVAVKEEKTGENNQAASAVKIGEIKRPDNSSTVFYKSPEGKMLLTFLPSNQSSGRNISPEKEAESNQN